MPDPARLAGDATGCIPAIVLARSTMLECTLTLPPRVAFSENQTVVKLARTAETSTAPSARRREKRASAHARGTDGKIAIGFEFQDWSSICWRARLAMIGDSLHGPAFRMR